MMARITVTVNGRRYDIGCDDGQEAHVFRLAEEIDGRIARLVAAMGQAGEARLLLLASLLLADEADELRQQLEQGREQRPEANASSEQRGLYPSTEPGDPLGAELRRLAQRIEAVAERLTAQPAIAGEAGAP
jgi:cell division protein ZapA